MRAKNTITAFAIILFFTTLSHSQSSNSYSVDLFNGIWMNIEDTTIIKSFYNGKYINILYSKDDFDILETGYYGFFSRDKNLTI